MRALDRHTIDTLGVPGEVLMESAGRAVVEVVLRERVTGGEVAVVCGPGNNGGDGLVVARHLHLLGVPVRAAVIGDPSRLRGDAAANLERARAVGVELESGDWRPPARGVVVDALFGTGLTRAVEGAPATAIERINAARGPELRVVSVDVPSGVDSDRGQAPGVAIRADATVTISLPKLGLALEPGRTLAGRIRVARVGIADRAPGAGAPGESWTAAGVAARLPERPSDGHKGRFGHVLVVAGSEGKTGAAVLAAAGAARGGAGLVTVACPAGLNDILERHCVEAMTAPVPQSPERGFGKDAEEALTTLADERDVVVCGPGVGRADETAALLRAWLPRVERPVVLDADGLWPFAGDPGVLKARRAPTILTPHPGEAARLLGRGAAEINRDRLGAARMLADSAHAVVVLKGAATVVAAPGEGGAAEPALVNPTGGPWLATGGTGDVLAGLVAALWAQGLDARDAAGVAVWLHGHAADRLARRRGRAGVLAGDLAAELPAAAEDVRADDVASGTGRGARASGGRDDSDVALLLPFPLA